MDNGKQVAEIREELWERHSGVITVIQCGIVDEACVMTRKEFYAAISDALLAAEAKLAEDRWTKDVPTEQGAYWHWNGEADAAPFPLTVMWSGTNNKCFICIKDMDGAPWCDRVGGWWMRMTVPSLPAAPAESDAHSLSSLPETIAERVPTPESSPSGEKAEMKSSAERMK